MRCIHDSTILRVRKVNLACSGRAPRRMNTEDMRCLFPDLLMNHHENFSKLTFPSKFPQQFETPASCFSFFKICKHRQECNHPATRSSLRAWIVSPTSGCPKSCCIHDLVQSLHEILWDVFLCPYVYEKYVHLAHC